MAEVPDGSDGSVPGAAWTLCSDCLGGFPPSHCSCSDLGSSHAGPLLHTPPPRHQGPRDLDLVTQRFPHSLPGGASRPPPHLLTSCFLTQSGLGVCPRGSSALGYGKPSSLPSFGGWEKPNMYSFIHSLVCSFIRQILTRIWESAKCPFMLLS